MGHLRQDRFDELEESLTKSDELYNPSKGEKDGAAFEDFKDVDDLLGPFLEVFYQAEYFWLPFKNIKKLEIQPPHTLRDLLWIPARIDLQDKPLGEVFVPVQYYGSSQHPDDLVKLGRMTDWKTVGKETLLGAGQRMFLIDDAECSLLEIRKIEFAGHS